MPRHPLRIAVLALAAVVLACSPAGDEVSSPASDPQLSLTGDLVGLANGAVKFATCDWWTTDSVQVTVGPAGGTIALPAGRLEIPAGALSSRVAISMVVPGDPVATIRFHPHGLEFPRDARPVLKMNFNGCRLPIAPVMVYVTENLRILEVLPSSVLRQQVVAPLSHFSKYAVAY